MSYTNISDLTSAQMMAQEKAKYNYEMGLNSHLCSNAGTLAQGLNVAPRRERIGSGILDEVTQLGGVLCEIEESIDALEQTLAPITRPKDKLDSIGDCGQASPSTELAATVRGEREHASRLAAKIRELTSRVGL